MQQRIEVTLEELAEMVRQVRADERRRLYRAGRLRHEWKDDEDTERRLVQLLRNQSSLFE